MFRRFAFAAIAALTLAACNDREITSPADLQSAFAEGGNTRKDAAVYLINDNVAGNAEQA